MYIKNPYFISQQSHHERKKKSARVERFCETKKGSSSLSLFFFFFAFAFCESNRLDYEFFNRVLFHPTRHVLDVLLETFFFSNVYGSYLCLMCIRFVLPPYNMALLVMQVF